MEKYQILFFIFPKSVLADIFVKIVSCSYCLACSSPTGATDSPMGLVKDNSM